MSPDPGVEGEIGYSVVWGLSTEGAGAPLPETSWGTASFIENHQHSSRDQPNRRGGLRARAMSQACVSLGWGSRRALLMTLRAANPEGLMRGEVEMCYIHIHRSRHGPTAPGWQKRGLLTSPCGCPRGPNALLSRG